MKDRIIILLTILLGFSCFLSFVFYASGKYIKNVAEYDVNQVHVNIHELNKDYNYCPHCGEYIGEVEDGNNRM